MLGHDVVKRGLHTYFEQYQWTNTELPDFVGSLSQAYEALGGDKDFNFLEWCDEWLTTSGVNIIEPVVTYKEDGSIEKLQVKQTNDLRGKNVLRRQKIDVAVYDSEFKPHVIKDVMISNKDALTDIEVPFLGRVTAINVNENDHAYAKTRFDQKTLESFVESLYVRNVCLKGIENRGPCHERQCVEELVAAGHGHSSLFSPIL